MSSCPYYNYFIFTFGFITFAYDVSRGVFLCGCGVYVIYFLAVFEQLFFIYYNVHALFFLGDKLMMININIINFTLN